MSIPKAIQMFESKWNERKFICVGLDSEYEKIPQHVRDGKTHAEAIFEFNKAIIDETFNDVLCYKPNAAFYEGEGVGGLNALQKTIEYIKSKDSSIPVILDAKRGDIGNTNRGYVKNAFKELGADAITVSPYLGTSIISDGQRKLESLAPFFEERDKLTIVLCRTSNPSAGEFQDLPISVRDLPEEYRKKFGDLNELSEMTGKESLPLYMVVAFIAAKNWNIYGNLGLVAGSTYPGELSEIRKITGDVPILIPGVGSQGGDLEATVKAGLDSNNSGIIVSSSRGIIFASDKEDFASAAASEVKKLNDQINSFA